jgi:TP901 family phage tail tape measure protein
MKALGLSISIGAIFSGVSAFGGAIKSTQRLKNEVKTLKNQRVDLGKKLGFASKEARKLNGDIVKLTRNTKLLDRAFAAQKGIRKYREDFRSTFMDKVALGTAVFAPMKVAIDFESAMADVKKVVNFDSNDELKAFQNEIVKLSKSIPIAADGLAQIVASGGQLGIAKDKLLGFTKTTAKMSTAFDMLPDEAGEASAKLMNVFGLSINQVSSLGDAINHLSDNTASKAKDVINVLSRVGGSAKVFGLSSKQTSSLASAFLSLGKPAEVSGTAINALLLKLGTADKQGKKFQDALQQIGLDSYTLKENIKQNGEQALMDFLEKINQIDKDDRMGVLSDMFGAEYSDDIALLSSGIDNYKKSIQLLNDEQKYNGSMQKEFQARSKTTANNLRLLGNTINAIAINFGSVLLPAVNAVLTPVREFSSWVGNVVAEHPTIAKYFGGFVAGAIGLSLALSGIGFVGSFVVGGILNIAKAALFMNSIFIMNPIGLVITAVVGLIGLGVVLYKNFEPFRNLIDTIWEQAKSFFGWIGDKISSLGSVLKSIGGFFGFGDDEDAEVTKESKVSFQNNLKTTGITQPNLNYASMPKVDPPKRDISQTNHIRVVVNNPSSNVDVEKAITKSMANKGNNRSLSDDMM